MKMNGQKLSQSQFQWQHLTCVDSELTQRRLSRELVQTQQKLSGNSEETQQGLSKNSVGCGLSNESHWRLRVDSEVTQRRFGSNMS